MVRHRLLRPAGGDAAAGSPPSPPPDAATLLTAPLLFRATILEANPGMTSRSLPPVHTYQLTVAPSTLYRGWLPPPPPPPPRPPPTAAAAAAADADAVGSGGGAAGGGRLTLFFSARQMAAPALPAAGDTALIVARPLPPPPPDGEAPPPATGVAVVAATPEALAAAAAVAAIPYGWAPEAGVGGVDVAALADPALRLVCPFPADAPTVRPPATAAVPRRCARTGRPAVAAAIVGDAADAAATAGVPPAAAPPGSLRLDVTPAVPAEVHPYRNPDGDGAFTLTLTNTTATPLTLPGVPVVVTPHRLRRAGRVVLWSAAAVVVAEAAAYALPPPPGGAEAAAAAAVAAPPPTAAAAAAAHHGGSVGGHIAPLVLGPGEAVTGSINVLAAGGVAWPKGGWRIPFVVGVGGATGGGGLYYLDSWHDARRAQVPSVDPAYAY